MASWIEKNIKISNDKLKEISKDIIKYQFLLIEKDTNRVLFKGVDEASNKKLMEIFKQLKRFEMNNILSDSLNRYINTVSNESVTSHVESFIKAPSDRRKLELVGYMMTRTSLREELFYSDDLRKFSKYLKPEDINNMANVSDSDIRDIVNGISKVVSKTSKLDYVTIASKVHKALNLINNEEMLNYYKIEKGSTEYNKILSGSLSNPKIKNEYFFTKYSKRTIEDLSEDDKKLVNEKNVKEFVDKLVKAEMIMIRKNIKTYFSENIYKELALRYTGGINSYILNYYEQILSPTLINEMLTKADLTIEVLKSSKPLPLSMLVKNYGLSEKGVIYIGGSSSGNLATKSLNRYKDHSVYLKMKKETFQFLHEEYLKNKNKYDIKYGHKYITGNAFALTGSDTVKLSGLTEDTFYDDYTSTFFSVTLNDLKKYKIAINSEGFRNLMLDLINNQGTKEELLEKYKNSKLTKDTIKENNVSEESNKIVEPVSVETKEINDEKENTNKETKENTNEERNNQIINYLNSLMNSYIKSSTPHDEKVYKGLNQYIDKWVQVSNNRIEKISNNVNLSIIVKDNISKEVMFLSPILFMNVSRVRDYVDRTKKLKDKFKIKLRYSEFEKSNANHIKKLSKYISARREVDRMSKEDNEKDLRRMERFTKLLSSRKERLLQMGVIYKVNNTNGKSLVLIQTKSGSQYVLNTDFIYDSTNKEYVYKRENKNSTLKSFKEGVLLNRTAYNLDSLQFKFIMGMAYESFNLRKPI